MFGLVRKKSSLPFCRVWLAAAIVGLTLVLSGCAASPSAPDAQATVDARVQATVAALQGGQGAPSAQTPQTQPAATPGTAVLTNDTWAPVLTDANSFRNAPVDLVGKVFLDPQLSGNTTAFQMYTTSRVTDGNTIVVADASQKPERGDYVRVQGSVLDQYQGTNAFGATLSVPRVTATNVTRILREDAIAPTVRSFDNAAAINQYGLNISLDRVELANNETRFYVTVNNGSDQNASVPTYNARVVQGSKQLEKNSTYDSGYPELPSQVLPGVSASAVLLFDAVDLQQPFNLVWDGPRAGSYSISFQPFQWVVDPSSGIQARNPVATARPASPPTAAPAATATAVTLATDPRYTVQLYYNLISARNFTTAWGMLTPRFQATQGSYNTWVNGYSQMQSTQLTDARTVSQSATSATVNITLRSVDNQGGRLVTKTFVGTWQLVQSNGQWLLDAATITQVG